jgi:hypothetical protein
MSEKPVSPRRQRMLECAFGCDAEESEFFEKWDVCAPKSLILNGLTGPPWTESE